MQELSLGGKKRLVTTCIYDVYIILFIYTTSHAIYIAQACLCIRYIYTHLVYYIHTSSHPLLYTSLTPRIRIQRLAFSRGELTYDQQIVYNMKHRIARVHSLGPYNPALAMSSSGKKSKAVAAGAAVKAITAGHPPSTATTTTAAGGASQEPVKTTPADTTATGATTDKMVVEEELDTQQQSATDQRRGSESRPFIDSATEQALLQRLRSSILTDQSGPLIEMNEVDMVSVRDMCYTLANCAYPRGGGPWSRRVGQALQLVKLGVDTREGSSTGAHVSNSGGAHGHASSSGGGGVQRPSVQYMPTSAIPVSRPGGPGMK